VPRLPGAIVNVTGFALGMLLGLALAVGTALACCLADPFAESVGADLLDVVLGAAAQSATPRHKAAEDWIAKRRRDELQWDIGSVPLVCSGQS
jgi:hypothetical protein